MDSKNLWRLFCKSGEPIYYLLYRRALGTQPRISSQKDANPPS